MRALVLSSLAAMALAGCPSSGDPADGSGAADAEVSQQGDAASDDATLDATEDSDGNEGGDADAEVAQPAPACPTQPAGIAAATVALPALNECSGLVTSRRQPGVLWAHNDSGDGATVYALGTDGSHRGTYTVTDAQAVDWEDMTLQPGLGDAPDRLLLGDIGDNDSKRSSVTVYAVDEPVLPGSGVADAATAPAEGFVMTYPDGARDAEGLVFDPTDRALYIISKERSTGLSGLYRYPPPLRANETVVLDKVATITLDDLGGGGSFLATGADITPDGRWLLLRTYDNVLGWYRPGQQPLAAAFSSQRCLLAVEQELQGEAIAATPDGTGYYTLSENIGQPLWYFSGLP